MESKTRKTGNKESKGNANALSSPAVLVVALLGIATFIFLGVGTVFKAVTNVLFDTWEKQIGIATGLFALLIILVLFIWTRALFYVHGDSKQRNMSPLLWVLICIFFPYLLGFLVYFLVRNPVPEKCPNCGSVVAEEDKFCQHCGHKLAAACEECGVFLTAEAKFCPGCGRKLEA